MWGPLVIAVDVDAAVLNTLRKWLPYYLTRLEEERASLSIGDIARPKEESYQNTLEDDEFPEGRLPAILVMTAEPRDVEMHGDGVYRAGWRVRVSTVVRGKTAPESRAVAAAFVGTCRRILTDHPSLDGFASNLKWIGGAPLVPVADETDQGRYLTAGMEDFTVYVDENAQQGGGPMDPGDPYPDPPEDPLEPFDPFTTVGDVTVAVVEKES